MKEELSMEERLTCVTTELRISQEIIRMLNERIQVLEKPSREMHISDDVGNDMELDESVDILQYKKTGFAREGPQFNPTRKRKQCIFECKSCDLTFESLGLLEAHKQEHDQENLKFSCEIRGEKLRKKVS